MGTGKCYANLQKDKWTVVNNYRPISILYVVSKIVERVIFKYVYNHLHENFILSTYQSSFLPGRFAVTQLIEVYHRFWLSIDRNKDVNVIFLDISKAFHIVWHKGLLYKLHKCGISWHLYNRQQRVVIKRQFSEFIDINAGVTQGFGLGPLFLLYIKNTMHAISNCQIRLFADDSCLFIEVDHREEYALLLNHDLESLQNGKWMASTFLDWLSARLPVCLSACLPACMSACLPTCLYDWLTDWFKSDIIVLMQHYFILFYK